MSLFSFDISNSLSSNLSTYFNSIHDISKSKLEKHNLMLIIDIIKKMGWSLKYNKNSFVYFTSDFRAKCDDDIFNNFLKDLKLFSSDNIHVYVNGAFCLGSKEIYLRRLDNFGNFFGTMNDFIGDFVIIFGKQLNSSFKKNLKILFPNDRYLNKLLDSSFNLVII